MMLSAMASHLAPCLLPGILHDAIDVPIGGARHDIRFEILAPLLVGIGLADGGKKLLELREAFDRVVGFDRRFAGADRAGHDPHAHLIGAGLRADLALPLFQQIDDRLLVVEPGIDVPSGDKHLGVFLFPLCAKTRAKRYAPSAWRFNRRAAAGCAARSTRSAAPPAERPPPSAVTDRRAVRRRALPSAGSRAARFCFRIPRPPRALPPSPAAGAADGCARSW